MPEETLKQWVRGEGALIVASDGLAEYDHPEIVFVVRPPEGADTEPIHEVLQELVGELAKSVSHGTRFGHGSLIRSPGGFIHPSLTAIVFTDPQGAFPEIAPGELLGLFLFDDEFEMYQRAGSYRVITRLGAAVQAYPFPLVSSWARDSVAHELDAASVLANVPRVHFPGATLTLSGTELTVRARPGHGQGLSSVIEQLDQLAFALQVDVAPQADARFVWLPWLQDARPSAISPPGSTGSRAAGGQIVVSVADDVDEDTLNVFEDGFALACSTDSWAAFADAFVHERPFAWTPPRGGLSLTLTFEPFDEDHVRLLVPEDQMDAAVSVEALSEYLRALFELLQDSPGLDLVVELSPDATPSLQPSRELPAELLERLAAVPAPPVTADLPVMLHKAGSVD